LSSAWGGSIFISPTYKNKNRTLRSAIFPVKDPAGMTVALGVISLDTGYIEDLTQQGATYFFLKAMAVVFFILVVFYLTKTSISAQRRILQGAKGDAGAVPDDRNNVSFVVDTFHSMVSTLKEKEKELKELKEQAEERAKSIEAYNENILKSIQSGVMTFDRQGIVVTSNAASEEILEMAEGSCTGKSYYEVFGPGSWLVRLIEKTISDGRPERRGEGELSVGGGQKWLGAGTSLLKADDGAISGVILVFTDITEVKGLRERMELKERIAVLGEMSAGIAHELRNPMGVISGYAEFLARSLSRDPSALEAVNSIRDEIKGMDEIIREFMSFSQPTNLTITEVDVNALLDESLKALSGTGEEVLRELVKDEGLPVIEGDAVLLRQAFINIIKNSIESIPDKGTVSVITGLYGSGVSPAAGISLPRGTYIRVEVTDTGIGMDEKQLAKIFMPFFTTKAKGTGLGLALVQKIIIYHGGRATVSSSPGKGSTFTVYLPARPLERNT
jgi:PAS domain S-box-containing protein